MEREAARAEREAAELQSKKQKTLQGFFGFADREAGSLQGSDKNKLSPTAGRPPSRRSSLVENL